MDKKLRSFICFSAFLMLFFLLIVIFFFYVYSNSTLMTYNLILLFLISCTIIFSLLFVFSITAVLYAYNKGHVDAPLYWLVKAGLSVFLPLISMMTRFLGGNEDELKSFYITVNNNMVQTENCRYLPEEVLVLLPHCLQRSTCTHKITQDTGNCQRCGGCRIGDISEIAGKAGVQLAVVTGGTAARNIVKQKRPKLILSVACERDLLSGIKDVAGIPVIGMVNERPNGPCINTSVNIDSFRRKLESILTIF